MSAPKLAKKTDVLISGEIHPAGVAFLKKHCRVKMSAANSSLDAPPGLKDLAETKVLLSLLSDRVHAELLQTHADLLGVANYAVGYNNIDVACATNLGIPVTNTPGVLTETTADLAWALILSVARRIPQAHEYLREGKFKAWGANLFLGSDVGTGPEESTKTLGIIGYGRIGQAVARRAHGFGMRVLVHTLHPENKTAVGVTFVDFATVLRQSDFLSLHCDLTEKTRHLLGEKQLQAMKRSAFIINTARGAIVDEKALVKALQSGVIAGAGLDVFENEPDFAAGLTALENVVLLPHIGSATHDTRAKMALMAAQNALALVRGEQVPHTVNREVYQTQAYQQKWPTQNA